MRQCVALSPTGEAPKGYVKTKQHNVKGSIKNKPSKDDRTRLKSHISWHAQTNHQTRQVFVPDADISVKSVKKTKGSPLNFYSRIVRYSPLVYPLAFQAHCCQLGTQPRLYTSVGSGPSLPALWLPWSWSARVLHGHLERGGHLDAA